jgi:hypothetical protein
MALFLSVCVFYTTHHMNKHTLSLFLSHTHTHSHTFTHSHTQSIIDHRDLNKLEKDTKFENEVTQATSRTIASILSEIELSDEARDGLMQKFKGMYVCVCVCVCMSE